MIKVNFRDGTTLNFNLNNEDDFNQWLEWSSVQDFQSRISGIGIIHNKKFHVLPSPKTFKNVKYYAEIVYNEKDGIKRVLGEKIECHADHIKLVLLVYTYDNPPPGVAARIDIIKIGKQMFSGVDINKRGIE